tara:strand:- start:564 stop:833 length:270 start_codon:yes stop_codon:yes gene_type:complete
MDPRDACRVNGQCPTGHETVVAHTGGHSCSQPGLREWQEANARRIAALPTVVEALKRVMDALAVGGVAEDCEEEYAEGEAALALFNSHG